jgi:hypothetical protein
VIFKKNILGDMLVGREEYNDFGYQLKHEIIFSLQQTVDDLSNRIVDFNIALTLVFVIKPELVVLLSF